MAQERNEMNGAEDTAEIKSEIERTRVEMSETLGEIQERLRPDHLVQQAKDSVTEAATGKVKTMMNSAGETATMMADQTKYAGRSFADYVRMHPVQMALIAGGITWWLLRGRDHSDDWEGASEGWHDDSYAYGDEASMRNRAGEYVSTARETVGEYASTARETAGEYAESARERARRASERMRTASLQARQRLNRASTSMDDWMHESPLVAGAVAVALGAAVGMSMPATEMENRALGEKRDQAMQRAREAARDLRDNVTQKVQNVAETVKDVATATTGGSTTGTTSSSSSAASDMGRV